MNEEGRDILSVNVRRKKKETSPKTSIAHKTWDREIRIFTAAAGERRNSDTCSTKIVRAVRGNFLIMSDSVLDDGNELQKSKKTVKGEGKREYQGHESTS